MILYKKVDSMPPLARFRMLKLYSITNFPARSSPKEEIHRLPLVFIV